MRVSGVPGDKAIRTNRASPHSSSDLCLWKYCPPLIISCTTSLCMKSGSCLNLPAAIFGPEIIKSTILISPLSVLVATRKNVFFRVPEAGKLHTPLLPAPLQLPADLRSPQSHTPPELSRTLDIRRQNRKENSSNHPQERNRNNWRKGKKKSYESTSAKIVTRIETRKKKPAVMIIAAMIW